MELCVVLRFVVGNSRVKHDSDDRGVMEVPKDGDGSEGSGGAGRRRQTAGLGCANTCVFYTYSEKRTVRIVGT